jgi:hypothetical protein
VGFLAPSWPLTYPIVYRCQKSSCEHLTIDIRPGEAVQSEAFYVHLIFHLKNASTLNHSQQSNQ